MSGLFGNKNNVAAIEPKYSSLRLQTSTFGAPIALVFGTNRVSPNLIWYGDFQAVAQQSSGGGGKGGGGSVTTGYVYRASVQYALCEGPIVAMKQLWQGNNKFATGTWGAFTQGLGGYAQSAWTFLTSNHSANALNYRGISWIGIPNWQYGSSDSLPNMSVEIQESAGPNSALDVLPTYILTRLLTDANFGLGFPSALLGTWTGAAGAVNYCQAYNILMSLALESQTQASSIIADLMTYANLGMFFSEGLLKIVPYGDTALTANSATFTPNLTPVYDLTDDDYVVSGTDEPVVCARKRPADCFNNVQVEYLDRTNDYNTQIADVRDQAAIDLYGLRFDSVKTAHMICGASIAQTVAQNLLQRGLYVRNVYTFKLPIRFCLVEPMDLLTITDTRLGLTQKLVRIISVEEDVDGVLTISAEEMNVGTHNPALFTTQTGSGYIVDYNASAAATAVSWVWEPPKDLWTTGGPEAWVHAAPGIGATEWGGYEVWVSTDNTNYYLAEVHQGMSKWATIITSNWTAGTTGVLDTTSTLHIQAQNGNSPNQWLSGTANDRDRLNTAFYIPGTGEIASYQTATLISGSNYDLTSFQRGAYATPAPSGTVGFSVFRLDGSYAILPLGHYDIGQTLYVKVVPFNRFGNGKPSLASITAISRSIVGLEIQGNYLLEAANLIPNGDSEAGYAAVNVFPDGNGLTYDPANAYSGNWCRTLLIPSGTSANLYFTGRSVNTYKDFLKCAPGDKFYLEAQLKMSSAPGASYTVMNIVFYDSAGAGLGTAYESASGVLNDLGGVPSLATVYRMSRIRAVAPAGAAYMLVGLGANNSGNVDAGKTVYVDNLVLKRATQPGAMERDGFVSLASSFYTDFSDTSHWIEDAVIASGAGSTFLPFSAPSYAQFGTAVGRATGGGSTHNFVGKVYDTPIPFDPNVLYRVRIRLKYSQLPATGGIFAYAGVKFLDSNLAPAAVTGSTQPYAWLCCGGATPGSGFTDYEGYFQGAGSVGIIPANDPTTPSNAPASTKFFVPIFAVNWDATSTGGPAITDIDMMLVETIARPTNFIGTPQLQSGSAGTLASTYVAGNSAAIPGQAGCTMPVWPLYPVGASLKVATVTFTATGSPVTLTAQGMAYLKGVTTGLESSFSLMFLVDNVPQYGAAPAAPLTGLKVAAGATDLYTPWALEQVLTLSAGSHTVDVLAMGMCFVTAANAMHVSDVTLKVREIKR